ncbi:MAG: hypothetical protein IKX20_02960 [Paludibacteraceae bacterium]|nr:hypothetical protein [Paludibacteraceae bacterium]
MAKGSSKAGGGGTKTKVATESYVFKPMGGDEVADRLNSATGIQISRSTITLKDENGKTQGMIRGFERMSEMSSNKLFSASENLRKAGVSRQDVMEIGQSNIFFKDGKTYVLNNTRSAKFLDNARASRKGSEFTDAFASDISKIQKKNEILKRMQSAGANIINY